MLLKKMALLLIITGLFLYAGCNDIDKRETTKESQASITKTKGTETPEISPSTEPTPTPKPPVKDYSELKKSLIEFIKNEDAKIGLHFINLVTGDEFGIDSTDEFIAASTSKLPMNLLLYKKIESGEVNPEAMLEYKEENFEPGTGIIHKEEFGTKYSVLETAHLSIKYSDNCAINMIIELLGINEIRQYMIDLGGFVWYGNRHRSCPIDMAIFARELYNSYISNPDVFGILIKHLENTVFNDWMNSKLPDDVRVAHKIGINRDTLNDVGIVFAREPFVLSIMSLGYERDEGKEKIAKITRMVYDFVDKEIE
jgi:beta-lactamase class A